MQIILIPGHLAKTRTLTLSLRLSVLLILLCFALLSALASGVYWMVMREAVRFESVFPSVFTVSAQKKDEERAREFVQQNLNAMAIKLGEMQAQLTRLDALGERLSSRAGLNPKDFRFSELPGLGGASPTLLPPQNLTMVELNERLQGLARDVESRSDMLGVLEARLFDEAIRKKLRPTMFPVNAPYNASGFGMRIDPITGQRAMHEGIDFLAERGTPVHAAADGVVTFAGYHRQYGYSIDIDHGNDLVTRYAHLSKLFVKRGDIVQRGLKVALTGSTGRSTGPHLHFEVRFKGVPQNPMRFLAKATSGPPVAQNEASGKK
ncbi:MAG: M23 family metallopeptidase [Betaproteobacteria bacterium]|nr:M23 family metallopeptidase [Betaproteobacteria bacterium]